MAQLVSLGVRLSVALAALFGGLSSATAQSPGSTLPALYLPLQTKQVADAPTPDQLMIPRPQLARPAAPGAYRPAQLHRPLPAAPQVVIGDDSQQTLDRADLLGRAAVKPQTHSPITIRRPVEEQRPAATQPSASQLPMPPAPDDDLFQSFVRTQRVVETTTTPTASPPIASPERIQKPQPTSSRTAVSSRQNVSRSAPGLQPHEQDLRRLSAPRRVRPVSQPLGKQADQRLRAEQQNVDPFVDDEDLTQDDTLIKPITSLTLDVRPPGGRMPADPAAEAFKGQTQFIQGREIPSQPVGTPYHWVAPGTVHQPLYFEEVNLERYGYSHGILQPAVSAAHFFGTLPALPYLVGAEHPHECIYTLGQYRPGDCVPLRCHYWPLSLSGATLEGGLATGLVFLIP
jgi:hypothetical protein